MSDDGFAAVMDAVAGGKRGAPRLLSFDDPPDDFAGFAVGLRYQDANGDITHRWVTLRKLDSYSGKLDTYCWMRREPRHLYLDRIIEAVDGDGQVMDGDDFAALLTGEAPAAEVDLAPVTRRPSRTERARSEAGRQAVIETIVAQRAAREETGTPQPAEQKRQQQQRIVGRFLWCAVFTVAGAALLPRSSAVSTLFALAFLLSILWLVAGLIKPRLVLVTAEKPTRALAFAVAFAAMAATLTLGVATQPAKPASPTQSQADHAIAPMA